MAKVAKKKTTTASKKKVTEKTTKKKTTSKKSTTAKKATVKKATRKKVTKKAVTAVKKTAKKKPERKKASSGLTKKQLEHYRELLIEKMYEILGDVNQMESDSLKDGNSSASSNLSNMPIHMADVGSDNFEQEFSLGLMDSERKLLKEIVEAINRIEDGTYGICEGTDKPIGLPRLEAKPWARYCIEYARMVESGLVVEGEKVYDEDEPDDYDEDDLDEDYEEDEDDDSDYGLDDFISTDDDEPDIDFSDDKL